MHRRTFFRTGVAAGLASLTRPASVLAYEPPPIRRAGPLRLNSNENPLGLAPAARSAVIEGLTEANRYPLVAMAPLREAIARRHGTTPGHVLLGNGSTEILRVAVAAGTMGATGTLIVADPTFEDVTDYAKPFPYRTVRVPLTSGFAHDLEAMREHARQADGPAVVYLCNPNNPTATLTDCAEIESWITEAPERVFFVLDEAYFEFVDDRRYRSFDQLAVTRPNVLVVRTFSKIFGMAGLRAGYGIAHADTTARLNGYATQITPNHLAQVAALASLEDPDVIARGRAANARGRRILTDVLDELNLEHLPSHANFVMHHIPGDLRTYQRRMRERGAWVGRPFPPMLSHNRVSIGLQAEMEEFAGILREFRQKGWV
ncbi:MAG: aminotransferase class I/II-fold pyridoxal phosphate-dependent enzyme [Gemmatimonadota bacterium]|nr:aminotransferase class I/II-fold pyridoxal phosphate-dependent enzyme [Gemmatimonadota bacterium]MDH5196054.1 aminotransferase class I/II-fold pyridoxal phosphate-dependent enzyme [Gemmatimonadota bacterium]